MPIVHIHNYISTKVHTWYAPKLPPEIFKFMQNRRRFSKRETESEEETKSLQETAASFAISNKCASDRKK